jgi:septation ring formation regulator EzrA
MKHLVQTVLAALLIGTASTIWGFSQDISKLNRTVYFLENQLHEIKSNQKSILEHLLELRKK